MATTYSLRSILAAAVLGPGLLLGASPSGCDCGNGPNLPETNAISGCGNSNSSNNEPRARDLTTSEERIAKKYGYTIRQVKQAIHAVKQKAGLGGKEVKVDIKTGEVYPQTPRSGIGDSVGNIFDFLP